jgi:phosphoserine phosphatase
VSPLTDRIDPPPPRRVYRWDLDKTYLKTEFDSIRQMVRTFRQKASQKVAVPGAAALIRELRAPGDARVCIVSGSPKQMRGVLEEKLKLDGVVFDEFILKDNVKNVLRGRFRALKAQVGYKLPALLESRSNLPVEAQEILFGDDAEADAFIYSLYADLIAGRVDEKLLEQILEHGRVYSDERERILTAWKKITPSDPVRRIFIHLDRLTPPARFSRYGPRVVPVFNYFQAALVLAADGVLTAPQVVKIGFEMAQHAGYSLLTLANSFQDLLRRGHPLHDLTNPLVEALQTPHPLFNFTRPVPDIVAAFTRRLAVLGTTPPPPPAGKVDYLALIDDARPRGSKKDEAQADRDEKDPELFDSQTGDEGPEPEPEG